MVKNKITTIFWLAIIFAMGSPAVFSANDQVITSTATLVKLQVVNACTLNGVTNSAAVLGNLNFGSIYKLNKVSDAVTAVGAGSFELRCTPGTTAKITLNAGLYGGNINNRKMSSNGGVTTVLYQLYTSSTRQVIWDDIIGVSVLFDTDLPKIMAVYGRIPMQPTPAAGLYTDQVVVTVSY